MGLSVALQPYNLMIAVVGLVLGIIVGYCLVWVEQMELLS